MVYLANAVAMENALVSCVGWMNVDGGTADDVQAMNSQKAVMRAHQIVPNDDAVKAAQEVNTRSEIVTPDGETVKYAVKVNSERRVRAIQGSICHERREYLLKSLISSRYHVVLFHLPFCLAR